VRDMGLPLLSLVGMMVAGAMLLLERGPVEADSVSLALPPSQSDIPARLIGRKIALS
jgi:hypothetical protein